MLPSTLTTTTEFRCSGKNINMVSKQPGLNSHQAHI